VSKEAGFLVNNLLFIGVLVVVFWGTILPLLTEAITGREFNVGPPFFNRVVSPLGALLLLLAAVAPVLPWRRGTVRAVLRRLARPAAAATVLSVAVLLATRRPDFAGLLWVAAFLGASSVAEILRPARARRDATGGRLSASIRRLVSGNPRRYGGYVVHAGVALMVVGFAGSLFRVQTDVVARPGETFRFAGATLTYEDFDRFAAPDKVVNRAVLRVRGGGPAATLRPQLNLHRNWDQPQSEIAIRSTPAADLYVILAGAGDGSGEVVFRLYHNPLVVWVWAGSVLAVAGSLVALLAGRRARIGPAVDHRAADRQEVRA
jgi:cytochrome c-type biogenesis protein CcmF